MKKAERKKKIKEQNLAKRKPKEKARPMSLSDIDPVITAGIGLFLVGLFGGVPLNRPASEPRPVRFDYPDAIDIEGGVVKPMKLLNGETDAS